MPLAMRVRLRYNACRRNHISGFLLGVGRAAHSLRFPRPVAGRGGSAAADMKIRKHPVVRKIEDEVERLLTDFGYELVQLKYGGGGGGRSLTVLIDRPDGVSVEDCSDMSRRLSMLLDTLDPIPSSYTLIVSSPGLDRPLTRDEDFERFAGELTAVRHVTQDGARRTDTGVLQGVEDEQVILQVGGEAVPIPLAEVEEAHLVYDWDAHNGR